MIQKRLFLGILIVAICMLLAGCGGDKECSKNNDCSSKGACYSGKCSSGKCSYTPKPDCCGNGKQDATENGKPGNSCTCPRDYGKCEDKSTEYTLFSCNDADECVSEASSSGDQSYTSKPKIGQITLEATYLYGEPFYLGTDKLTVRFSPESENARIQDLNIRELKVFEAERRNRKNIKLIGEKLINQKLYSTESIIEEKVILSPIGFVGGEKDNETAEEKYLVVEVFYEYNDVYRGAVSPKSGSFKSTFSSPLTVVDTGTPTSCGACNDGNSCTDDACVNVAGYTYCDSSYITSRACCGNKICEESENKCSCPTDCGPCAQTYGTYIQYACSSSNVCLSDIKDVTLVKEKSLVFSTKTSGIKSEVRVSYNEPFDVEKDSFHVVLTPQLISEYAKDVKVTGLKLVESSELLGDVSITKNIDASTLDEKIPADFDISPDAPEEERNVVLKISLNYDKVTGTTEKETLAEESFTLGKIVFIDPALS